MWDEVEGEDAALPSSEPIPAGEAGADTIWTSSPCGSRAPSTLSWQTATAWSVKLTQGHQQEGKSSLTTQSQTLPAEMPSAHHLSRARSMNSPPPYSQEVQTPDLKTLEERKECSRRAEVLEGSPQSSEVRNPLLAGPKRPCLHVYLLWAAVQIPGLEESPMMPQEAFQTSSPIHLLLPGDAGGPKMKMNKVTESSTVIWMVGSWFAPPTPGAT